MKTTVIITAGGIGKRMGGDVPKQFLLLGGKPILMRSIECFYAFDEEAQILVTLPSDWWDFWLNLCKNHNFTVPHNLVEGGIERYDSVKNALNRAEGNIIAVHDGVRPFVSANTIQNCLQLAQEKGSAVPVLPLKESLRKGSFHESDAQNRSEFFSVQTPQCYKSELLIDAYHLPFSEHITDDASLVEKAGFPIFLTLGNEENIKITTPIDLKIGEVLINS
jgi:2-C-methyl-D-erythritol 4-phosphate cytidylyltransferase